MLCCRPGRWSGKASVASGALKAWWAGSGWQRRCARHCGGGQLGGKGLGREEGCRTGARDARESLGALRAGSRLTPPPPQRQLRPDLLLGRGLHRCRQHLWLCFHQPLVRLQVSFPAPPAPLPAPVTRGSPWAPVVWASGSASLFTCCCVCDASRWAVSDPGSVVLRVWPTCARIL